MKKRFNLKIFKDKFKGLYKWLYPGIGIKRWIGLTGLGVILVAIAVSFLGAEEYWVNKALDNILLVCGIIILVLGIRRINRSLISAFIPSSRNDEIVEILYHRKQIGRGPKIVAVGGGTGLSVLLNGLKEYTSNITAIVTVADSGGSSGRLRQQFDILPPGDIRNCLVALADAPALMRDLFQFRFTDGSDLAGHNFGNIFITAMTQLTGDFEKAVKETSKVLALRGQVLPSTLSNITLAARYSDGSVAEGEDKIPKAHKSIDTVFLKPEQVQATPEAIRAIEEAQIIVLGPGSLYTSIVPNLLISEITDKIAVSGAIKVYVCNVMTQPGETDGYKVSDHINAIAKHAHPQLFDYCVVNIGEIPKDMLQCYAKDNSYPVISDTQVVKNMGYRLIEDDIVLSDGFIRHDPLKLTRIILGFLEEI